MYHFFSDQEYLHLNFLTEDDFVRSHPHLMLNDCNRSFLSDPGLTTVIGFLADSISEQLKSITDSPVVIGVSGSVSSGKSFFSSQIADILRTTLNRKISVISSDNFIYPSSELISRNIMHRKGFPESYDYEKMLGFLKDFVDGKQNIEYPVYSHETYDILPAPKHMNECDILIFEGINVLEDSPIHETDTLSAAKNVRDFFCSSIYLDASEKDIFSWYLDRCFSLIQDAENNEQSFFRNMIEIPRDELLKKFTECWDSINHVNLIENILPSIKNADLIVKKDKSHRIVSIKQKPHLV